VSGSLWIGRLFRDIVILPLHDFLEPFYRVGNFHVPSRATGELFRDVERLREETLDLTGARDGNLLIFTELINTENRNDVLQIFVRLECLLDHLRNIIMFLPDNARVKNARGRSEGIDSGINTDFGEGAG